MTTNIYHQSKGVPTSETPPLHCGGVSHWSTISIFSSNMYEDSQRFSSDEEEEGSHIVTFNPRSLVGADAHRSRYDRDNLDPYSSLALTMQRGADEQAQSPLKGGDETVDTPEYANIREESMQRILNRLSPNRRRAFLRTMSESESEVQPPAPFTIPETNDEYDCSVRANFFS